MINFHRTPKFPPWFYLELYPLFHDLSCEHSNFSVAGFPEERMKVKIVEINNIFMGSSLFMDYGYVVSVHDQDLTFYFGKKFKSPCSLLVFKLSKWATQFLNLFLNFSFYTFYLGSTRKQFFI